METIEKNSSVLLKDTAKQLLLGKYKTVVLAYFIMELITTIPLQLIESQLNLNTAGGYAIYMAAYLIVLLLTAVFTLGQNFIYLKIARFQEYKLSDMWYGFKYHADKAILANIILLLKSFVAGIPFIIALCLVVFTKNYYLAPLAGLTCVFFIIAATYIQLTYSQVYYLMLDYPEKSAKDLLAHSARLMKGNKLRLFYLQVSFLGLMILGAFSLGIGLFWVMPYMLMTKTGFYENIRKFETNNGRESVQ